MLYFDVVMSYWLKLIDEGHYLQFREDVPNKVLFESVNARSSLGIIDDDHFYILFNTLSWLQKFIGRRTVTVQNNPLKPTNEELLFTLNFIEQDAIKVLNCMPKRIFDTTKRSQKRRAKRKLEAVAYYRKLVNQGFFQDKELSVH